jgi:hypothetical protein
MLRITFAPAEPYGTLISKITPSGAITEYPITNSNNSEQQLISATVPFGITAGPDGNLCLSEPAGSKVLCQTSGCVAKVTPSGAVSDSRPCQPLRHYGWPRREHLVRCCLRDRQDHSERRNHLVPDSHHQRSL